MIKTNHPLITGRPAPFLAALAGLTSTVIIGFRGFGDPGLAWLDRSQNGLQHLLQSPPEPTLLIDLFAAGLSRLPLAQGWILVGLTFLASALTTGLLFQLGRQLNGVLTGWIAVFFALTAAPYMGIFTSADPTALAIPLVAALILAWFSDLPPWIRGGLCGLLLALTALSTPFAALLILVFLLVIAARRSEISLDHLLAPLLASALLLAALSLWGPPLAVLHHLWLSPLSQSPDLLLFRGQIYPPRRPPLYFGAAWILEQLPIVTAIVLLLSLFLAPKFLKGKERHQAITLSFIALLLMLLPVFLRTSRPLGLHFEALFLLASLPLGAVITVHFLGYCMGPDAPALRLRRFAIAVFVVIATGILLESRSSLAYPESQRSPLTARLLGWSVTSDLPQREPFLPLEVVRLSLEPSQALLYLHPWEDHLHAYAQMGLISANRLTDDPENATTSIRALPAIALTRFARYDQGFVLQTLEGSTRAIPGRHRPIFFIDQSWPARTKPDSEHPPSP